MPKMKTHSAAKKRLVISNNKAKHATIGRAHLLSSKPNRQSKTTRKALQIATNAHRKTFSRLLGTSVIAS